MESRSGHYHCLEREGPNGGICLLLASQMMVVKVSETCSSLVPLAKRQNVNICLFVYLLGSPLAGP